MLTFQTKNGRTIDIAEAQLAFSQDWRNITVYDWFGASVVAENCCEIRFSLSDGSEYVLEAVKTSGAWRANTVSHAGKLGCLLCGCDRPPSASFCEAFIGESSRLLPALASMPEIRLEAALKLKPLCAANVKKTGKV